MIIPRPSRTELEGCPDELPPSRRYALAWIVAAVLCYGGIAAFLIEARTPHRILTLIALQAAVLGPPLAYLFTRRFGNAPIAWNSPTGGSFAAGAAFVALALAVSHAVGPGLIIDDENSYRFQARIFGAGKLVADTPYGATPDGQRTPTAIEYVHHIAWQGGWFTKYPAGWPLLLALPERLDLGWTVAPALAAALLGALALCARAAFGKRAAFPAVWMAVLSPFFLANAVGRMPHALSGALIAAAAYFCIRGIEQRRLSHFGLMFAFLALDFHVRPFSAFLASATLSIAALASIRRDKHLCLRAFAVGASAGTLAIGSILLYNRFYTGDAWLSPYALWRGVSVPLEVSAGPMIIARNLTSVWRMSAQSTVAFAFPFVFLLAAYGFWIQRRSAAARTLAALFPVFVIGHLVQVEPSTSFIGERYWFEAYFAIAILGARGLLELLARRPLPKRTLAAAALALTVAQGAVMAASANILLERSAPYRAVATVAEDFHNCNCVVFLSDASPVFVNRTLNLNSANWKAASAVYLRDPGADQRKFWTQRFGRKQWVLVVYEGGRAFALDSQRNAITGAAVSSPRKP